MKKFVGFIFMLVMSLVLSVTTYAADDLGNLVAKVSSDKKKDEKGKNKSKKKNKKKKNKKKAKKSKKNKKKSKKIKKAKKTEQQLKLKDGEEVEEILDDYTSNEEEKKDLSVVELKVKSASKIWTNKVDVVNLDIEKTLNELLIGKDGYPTAPAEVINFFNKYKEDNSEYIEMNTSAGDTSNYLVVFDASSNKFAFITKDSLAYFKVYVNKNSDLNGYDINDFSDKLKTVGLRLDITTKQLDSIFKGESKAVFKAGNISWEFMRSGDDYLSFNRVENSLVNFTKADVFKACAMHRLVFTNSFYSKFSKLLKSDWVALGSDTSSNYRYNKAVNFKFSKITDGELGVVSFSYSDDAEYRETELHISGNINIDSRVSDLAKILDEYTGIDLYTFDTSRIENMLKGDAIQEFNVDFERNLGDSNVRISITNNGEKTFQFSVIFTRKY